MHQQWMKLTLMKDVRSMWMNPSFIRTSMYTRLMRHAPSSTPGLESLKIDANHIRRCPGCRSIKRVTGNMLTTVTFIWWWCRITQNQFDQHSLKNRMSYDGCDKYVWAYIVHSMLYSSEDHNSLFISS
jgi:hypothetical protein